MTTKELVEVYRRKGHPDPVAAACGNGANPSAPKRNIYAPFRSKVELAYASYLSAMVAAKVYRSWEYEPENWRLGFKCFYRPDFRVTLADGSVEWHETKGRQTRKRKDGSTFDSFYAPPKNWLKLKIAAAKFPKLAVFVVWPADRSMATWSSERVPAGAPEVRP